MSTRTLAASSILTWRATAWRSRVVLMFLWGGLTAVMVKAFLLQHVHVEQWQKRAEVRYERQRDLPASRGRLLDRNGTVLAVSIPEMRVGVSPKLLSADHPKLKQAADILGQPVAELRSRIRSAKHFFYLASGLDIDRADRLKALGLPGLEFDQEFRRHYPFGEALSNVIGFTDLSDLGQEGLERAMDRQLRGTAGAERVLVDRRNQVFGARQNDPAKPGEDVQLSIDAGLQSVAYQAAKAAMVSHKAKGAAAVVLDPRSGEVLALANAPSFDPNQRQRLDPNRVRNRAVADSFEPGSTLKPFAIATAMDAGLVRPNTTFQTAPGQMSISGRVIRDSHAHGLLTVSEILQKSSNIGTAQIALRIPAQTLHEHYRAAGFGLGPPLSLPGAVAGRLRPWQSWVAIDQATISYGHGIAVSLVQLARSYSVFAREGDIVPVSLHPVSTPVVGSPVFSARTAAAVREMLELATGPGGTAPKAQIQGFRVAGKTGTAHKPERGGYSKTRFIASFVGFVPADQPRLVIAVMIDEPSAGQHYGGDVAAPVFAQIASESLRRLQMSPNPSVRVLPSALALGEGT
ncbi:MAG: penicillin-binding protein 2 [Betaproteobacteria bacterium]|nr:penicillin-binding protein 2 [Betaproteobacteria bacterium]NBT74759.1 penicillin-binding protein 2 [Betaproteobacteria bacterium]NCA15579.1 penicillin-binding protein 2 [Betaproteobacteria bacterium]